MLKACCMEEAEELKKRIFELRARQQQETETLTEKNPWLVAFGGISPAFTLTKELAKALIERITVFKDDRVEVALRFRDEREKLLCAVDKEVVA